jgi:hypothetical protein
MTRKGGVAPAPWILMLQHKHGTQILSLAVHPPFRPFSSTEIGKSHDPPAISKGAAGPCRPI